MEIRTFHKLMSGGIRPATKSIGTVSKSKYHLLSLALTGVPNGNHSCTMTTPKCLVTRMRMIVTCVINKPSYPRTITCVHHHAYCLMAAF